MKIVLVAIGAVSCTAIGTLIGGNIDISWQGSANIASVDLIAIVLSALSVMLTILTIFLAVLGFIGLSTINDRLAQHSRNYFNDELQEGRPAFGLLKEVVRSIVYEGIDPVDGEEDFVEQVEAADEPA